MSLGISCPSCNNFLDNKHLFSNGLKCSCNVTILDLCKTVDNCIPSQYKIKIVYVVKKNNKFAYVGSTNNLQRRTKQHMTRQDGALYGLKKLTYANLNEKEWSLHISLILGELYAYLILKPYQNMRIPSGKGTNTITFIDKYTNSIKIIESTYPSYSTNMLCDNIASFNDGTKITYKKHTFNHQHMNAQLQYYHPVCGLLDRQPHELKDFCCGPKMPWKQPRTCMCKFYCPAQHQWYKRNGNKHIWYAMKNKEVEDWDAKYGHLDINQLKIELSKIQQLAYLVEEQVDDKCDDEMFPCHNEDIMIPKSVAIKLECEIETLHKYLDEAMQQNEQLKNTVKILNKKLSLYTNIENGNETKRDCVVPVKKIKPKIVIKGELAELLKKAREQKK